jgi:protein ImuA
LTVHGGRASSAIWTGARRPPTQYARLLSIHGKPGDAPSLLWATREALQCGDVHCVLAWLPDARSAHLRRLQIAAHAHNKLLFVFRPLRAQQESSPAPLRLLMEGTVSEAGNLLVHVLKRRGPPLAAPVLLDTRPARLSALLAASRERARRQREELAPMLLPSLVSLPVTSPQSPIHALLDRIAHLDHH